MEVDVTDSSSTVLVVGASSGFGAATAERFLAAGYRVIGTSRRAPPLGDVVAGRVNLARLDVTDDASVAALRARLDALGIVPRVLVINAGYGEAGAVEASSVEALHAQLDTNLYGAHRVVCALLPGLRRHGGRILLVGSLAARVPIPFQGLYSASKAALVAWAEALRQEVRAFGVHVTVVEPGDHATAFGGSRRRSELEAYEPQATNAIAVMEAAERAGGPPDRVARALLRLAHARNPPLRRFVGGVAERFVLLARWMLPASWFERGVMWNFGVPTYPRSRPNGA